MKDIANGFPNPHLTLQHSTVDGVASQVVPYQIPLLTGKGYKMVTTNKCVTDGEDWPYTYVSGYGTRDSSWKC